MSEAISSRPNTPSWRGAQLKAQGQLLIRQEIVWPNSCYSSNIMGVIKSRIMRLAGMQNTWETRSTIKL